MDFNNVILLYFFKFAFVSTATYQKPAYKSLWPEKCKKGDAVLNDCNWCYCDTNLHFQCKARVCGGVDMFGHFNDAIQELNVGIEGHGVWRSTATPCEPKVQYEREGLICICSEDGAWPSPVCRDAFRVLHSVTIADGKSRTNGTSCDASKLYLNDCNVCFCPISGTVDPALCTTKNCTKDDPALYENRVKAIRTDATEKDERATEVYAECELHRKYKFGYQTCMCLSNNRLLCDECNKTEEVKNISAVSYCDAHSPEERFTADCNVCVCDKKGLIYCTTRQCYISKTASIPLILDESMKEVETPYDVSNCVPGTKYKIGCKNCYCLGEVNGEKSYSCSLEHCKDDFDPIQNTIHSYCVEGTTYETRCQICRCHSLNGIQFESCYVNDECTNVKATKLDRELGITPLHGYCEPFHTYQKDCNTCRCLLDGKTLMCTSTICKKKDKKPIIVDIVPINQSNGSACPRDHMYRVDCNICFCLSNGNVLCSTADCKKSRHKRN